MSSSHPPWHARASAVSSPARTSSAPLAPSDVASSATASKSAPSDNTSRTCRVHASLNAWNCGTDVAAPPGGYEPSPAGGWRSSSAVAMRGAVLIRATTASSNSAAGLAAAMPCRHSAQHEWRATKSAAASLHPIATSPARQSQKPVAVSGRSPASATPSMSARSRTGSAPDPPKLSAAPFRRYHSTSRSVTAPVPSPGSTKYTAASCHAARANDTCSRSAVRLPPVASDASASRRSTSASSVFATALANREAASTAQLATPSGPSPRCIARATRSLRCSKCGRVSSASSRCTPVTHPHCTTYAAPLDISSEPSVGVAPVPDGSVPRTRDTRSSLPNPHCTCSTPAPGPVTAPPPIGRVAMTGTEERSGSMTSIEHVDARCVRLAWGATSEWVRTAGGSP
mmetsp:Transcript_2960/g.11649  ORF Transcript_2960/g.11649 Transcript_2960/m.11649 type:complete len:400 (+) Transcript_2960:260-1459(+)